MCGLGAEGELDSCCLWHTPKVKSGPAEFLAGF
jgi:hypothetical protein